MISRNVRLAALAVTLAATLLGPSSEGQESDAEKAAARLPELVEQFESTDDEALRRYLAGETLRMAEIAGVSVEGEAEMHQVLLAAASEALELDPPSPFAFDADGRVIEGDMNPELTRWAEEHGMAPGEAAQYALYEQPAAIVRLHFVPTTPQSLTIVREALGSTNPTVVLVAARYLVTAGDTTAIRAIETVALGSPQDLADPLADILEDLGTAEGREAAAKVRASFDGS